MHLALDYDPDLETESHLMERVLERNKEHQFASCSRIPFHRDDVP